MPAKYIVDSKDQALVHMVVLVVVVGVVVILLLLALGLELCDH